MSFAQSQDHDRRAARQYVEQRQAQRRRVLYLTDQIGLAVFHKRPQHEINTMLADLRAATGRKDN